MSLFSRAHDIIAAKANKTLDSAEDPNEMLDYSYQQMLDQVTRVRRGLVDIAASRKRIELQEQQLQHTVDHLNDQAQAALAQGREDLAREALVRKSAAQQQISAFEEQHNELTEQEQKLGQALGQLQDRVNHFRSQKEVMKAQYTAAQASASVNATAAGINSDYNDTAESLARAQDKIDSMQARAGALDELMQSGVLEDVGGDTDDIQDELDKVASDADVDQQLAALKARMAAPELPPGGGAAEGTAPGQG
jgi:phage shock protein A